MTERVSSVTNSVTPTLVGNTWYDLPSDSIDGEYCDPYAVVRNTLYDLAGDYYVGEQCDQ